MALNASNIISSKGLIRKVDLILPERQDIADGKSVATTRNFVLYNHNMFNPKITTVLDRSLRKNYMTVSVEWVTSHPVLSDPPFNLAASGICGNTALLDFGDMSYLEVPFPKTKKYNFKQFLEDIGRDNKDSFIFGHGIHQSLNPRGHHILRELVLNTSFPPSTNEVIESRNKSRVIYIDKNGKCNPAELSLYQLECTGQGTYFLCDGSRTNASVLKVRAEEPFLPDFLYSRTEGFIYSMQRALQEKFGSKHFVALGGVYTVNPINNRIWKHKLYPNNWENRRTLYNQYCKINEPHTMIATFNSSTELPEINPGPSIKLNSSKSIHSLSHHSASVDSPVHYEKNWEVKYVGYFCPVTTLYRFDELL